MNQPHDLYTPTREPTKQSMHGGHGWMMIACCVPMLLIVLALVATGAVGVG
jgi:hypothetical protein